MAEKSKILIIGGTGYIGKFIVEASSKAGHPTFVLIRETTISDPFKAKLIGFFKNSGVTMLHGDVYDHGTLVRAIKQVDVVISAVGGGTMIEDQVKIIAAIKEARNIMRFFPSEFGNDVNRSNAVEPAKSAFAMKAQIRRAVEAEGIPIHLSLFYLLAALVLLVATFNEEHDIGTYTIKAVDDPRTLNKILYIRPPKNIYSFNELVSLWEKKIGLTLQRIYVPEEQILKQIQESPTNKMILSINHSVFAKGDQNNFEIEPAFGVEASGVFPDVKYMTVEEYLDRFV
ncbi:hypothetical protein TEA_022228 [Camellia sinensis var. sinensis]|uniref:NmrA-like domain-containing protein n=1 Tax=Camellia sinensis var. sinensis TaxID=542762 RepID=A0A4V3WJR0_CAMSN|nr:hypothetical protein TEA_022228 [Camellia sinensis var. sinensis]